MTHIDTRRLPRQDAFSVAPTGLTRRTFIAGLGAAAALAACGGEGDAGGDAANTATVDIAPGTYTLAQRFPNTVLVPGEVRLPHSLFQDASFVNDGPEALGAQVVDLDGNPIGGRLVSPRYDVTPSAYYAWRTTIDTPGVYSLLVDGGPVEGAAFQIFDPASVAVPGAGDPLPGFDTPTATSPAGVDPICTRDPFCPFHEVTLTEALADGRGVAYLVGTPAFCQTGTCAPALEAMIETSGAFADDFIFVHAEVFTDLTAQEIAPAVGAVNLSYEPALLITDATGTIVERLDAIWGVDELSERLEAARA